MGIFQSKCLACRHLVSHSDYPYYSSDSESSSSSDEEYDQKETGLDGIPHDILNVIYNMLDSPGDGYRFEAVCRTFKIASALPFGVGRSLPSSSSAAQVEYDQPQVLDRTMLWFYGPVCVQIFPAEVSWDRLNLDDYSIRNGEYVYIDQASDEEEEYDDDYEEYDDDDEDEEEEQFEVVQDHVPPPPGSVQVYPVPVQSEDVTIVCVGSSLGFLAFYDSMYRFFLLDARDGYTIVPLPFPRFPNFLEVTPSPNYFTYNHNGHEIKLKFSSTFGLAPTSIVISSRTDPNAIALCRIEDMYAMAFCQIRGGDRWFLLPRRVLSPAYKIVSHVYHNGRFYLLEGLSMRLYSCDISGVDMSVSILEVRVGGSIELLYEAMEMNQQSSARLVVCGKDLLVVVDNVESYSSELLFPFETDIEAVNASLSFRVFKLGETKEVAAATAVAVDGDWVEVNDIGWYSLFLGANDSFALSTRDFPTIFPNCIYLNGWFRILWLLHPVAPLSYYDFIVCRLSDGFIIRARARNLPFASLQMTWLDPRLQRY